jgi:multiple sugar transport system substrate-binding protein
MGVIFLIIKKWVSSIIASAMAVSLLAGCGSSSESTAKPKNPEDIKADIVVAGWPSGDKAFEAILPEFNKKYPNIHVKMEFQKSADHHNKLLSALAAGAGAPDVSMVEAGYIGKFRDKKGFVNLLDQPYNAGGLANDFVDYKWNMAKAQNGKQLIGIPWDIGPLSLFYRRDIFKAAGLPDDPAEVQKLVSTWDGYLDVAKKVSKPGQVFMVSNAADMFMSKYANRDYYNEDLSFRFDSPESLKLLQIASTVRKEGLDAKVAFNSTEWQTMLKQGQVATQISGSWFGGFLKTFIAPETSGKWGVVRAPGEASNWGGSFLAIPEQSKNKEAAWAFIQFALTQKEQQNKMFKTVDYFPALKSAWDDPAYHEADPFFGGEKTRELWINVAKDTKPSFVTIMDKQTEDIMRTDISTGLDQGLDPKSVLEKAKNDVLKQTAEDRKQMQDLIEKEKK